MDKPKGLDGGALLLQQAEVTARARRHREWLERVRREKQSTGALSAHEVYVMQCRWVQDPHANRRTTNERYGSAAQFAMWAGS